MLKRILRNRQGEGYIDVCVLVLCAMLVIVLAEQVLPVLIAKNQLDTYATELCREAKISGRVGSETSRRTAVLTEQTGLSPRISWSKSDNIQLNEEITVTLTLEKNIGLFGGFSSFPITLRAGLRQKRGVPQMSRLKQILKDKAGVSFPLVVAIALALIIILCGVIEFFTLEQS